MLAPITSQHTRKTSKFLNIPNTCHQIVNLDGIKYLNNELDFNIIFADPPFDYTDYEGLIDSVNTQAKLKTVLSIVEHFKKVDLSALNGYQKSHMFGNVCLVFLTLSSMGK